MREFKGRVAVVTGAASGIGFGLAERFAAEGMRVVLADVEAAALECARARLAEAGAEALAVQTDVADAAAVEALAARAYAAFGAVHVLCNNAGVVAPGRLRPVWEQPLEDWRWTLEVNLMGVIHGIRSFVPRMLDAGEEGHVVNTGSVTSFVSGGAHVVYSTSKFGVARVSEALHANLAERSARIGVTLLCPGVVVTNLGDAERNRPTAHRPATVATEAGNQYGAALQAIRAVALGPAELAGTVLEAIREGRFYVFTTTAWDDPIRARAEDIVARAPPRSPDLAALIDAEARERGGGSRP